MWTSSRETEFAFNFPRLVKRTSFVSIIFPWFVTNTLRLCILQILLRVSAHQGLRQWRTAKGAYLNKLKFPLLQIIFSPSSFRHSETSVSFIETDKADIWLQQYSFCRLVRSYTNFKIPGAAINTSPFPGTGLVTQCNVIGIRQDYKLNFSRIFNLLKPSGYFTYRQV